MVGWEIESIGDLKQDEYKALTEYAKHMKIDDFQVRPEVIPEDPRVKKLIASVLSVERLREVRALVKFTRMNKKMDKDTIFCDLTNDKYIKWLPVLEVFGEGIFIELNKNVINDYLESSELRKNIPDLPVSHYDFNKVKTILDPFLIKNYKMVSKHIYSMFKSYHREVVGRISYYIEAFEELIDEYNPHLNLCSSGSRDVIDCVFNYLANQREIPVVYFQHGGTLLFFNDFYQIWLYFTE